MEFKTANREWVKNAAIIFLAVLLVLTFFSNTIMNRSLVEVATARVTDGNIVAKVRGTGTVTASGKHHVKATKTRSVRSVIGSRQGRRFRPATYSLSSERVTATSSSRPNRPCASSA